MSDSNYLIKENSFYSTLLLNNLKKIFGDFDETILHKIEDEVEWMELEGGEILLREGDQADGLYFVLSGRLLVTKLDATGVPLKLGEILRGETVGEMAVFTGEVRYATITAIRDSVLVKLSKEVFEEVIRLYPEVALSVTRLIIERSKKIEIKKNTSNTINICFVPLHQAISSDRIAREIRGVCSNSLKIKVLKSQTVLEEGFQLTESQDSPAQNSLENKKLIQWLNNLEAQHDFMFFAGDFGDTVWNRKCIRQADLIVLLADATVSPEITSFETYLQVQENINMSLTLLHPTSTLIPQNTRKWLDIRPVVQQHFHIREGNTSDLHRFARIITGKANGIVLAGGGAKGFAHIGVLKALEEKKIPVDLFGGTSVGAMMACACAFDQPLDSVIYALKNEFLKKLSSDLSFIPMISLVKGNNLKKMIQATIHRLCGMDDLDISDTWIPVFVVTSNYSKSEQNTFHRGSMVQLLLASGAIPGIFPPVIINGQLHVDGGVFNNFPVDIMRNIGVEKVIGVDFRLERSYEIPLQNTPTNWEFFKQKFLKKRRKRKKLNLPNISSIIINSTLLNSNAKRNELKPLINLHFNPDVSRVGLTSWGEMDKTIECGYEHAKDLLGMLSDDELKEYQLQDKALN